MSQLFVIKNEPESACEFCGKVAELRPYGPQGESVCFKCGMQDEEAAEQWFDQLILGIETENKPIL